MDKYLLLSKAINYASIIITILKILFVVIMWAKLCSNIKLLKEIKTSTIYLGYIILLFISILIGIIKNNKFDNMIGTPVDIIGMVLFIFFYFKMRKIEKTNNINN